MRIRDGPGGEEQRSEQKSRPQGGPNREPNEVGHG